MIDIAYIVSHGFAARMVMQTNLLGKLVKEGKKVALIAPDRSDANLIKYCKKNDVQLTSFESKSSFWNVQYNEARKYLFEDIKKNPALWEKHIYATKYNRSKNPWKQLRPRLLILLHYLVKAFPRLQNWFIRREERHLDNPDCSKFIEELNPQILVSTYPVNFIEAQLLKAGNENHTTKTIIHLLSWDNISCKGRFPQLADEYIAWGPIMEEELQEYYKIPKSKIHVCGVPHFDVHVKSKNQLNYKPFLKELGINPEERYIFFGMSSPRFAPNEIDIVEWIAKQIEENLFGPNTQLIVRPHPQNVQGGMADQSWLPRLDVIKSDRVRIDYPKLTESKMPWSMQQSDMERLSQLITGSALVLNSGSTISIDALMCERPVILTSFDGDATRAYWDSARRLIDYTHLNKLVSYGGVTVTKSFKELEKEINNYLGDKNFNSELRKTTIERQSYTLDGQATSNVLNALLSLN